MLGIPCDVSHFDQLKALWDRTYQRFGKIDFWVNNAGVSNTQMEIWKSSPDEVKTVVETSLTGAIYGSMVAVDGFLKQGFRWSPLMDSLSKVLATYTIWKVWGAMAAFNLVWHSMEPPNMA
jgi:NAD(P)-dependent dehydrogenase (short-subunit alcohol dehydrogenase family)